MSWTEAGAGVKKGRAWRRALTVFLLLIAAGAALFRYYRSPSYVWSRVTPPHEEAAAAFFRENREELERLAELRETLGPEERFSYTFHAHEYDSLNIPAEAAAALLALEGKAPEGYTVSLTQVEITVAVASGTNYDVYLYLGPDTAHSVKAEWEREIPLEDGWTVQAPYVVRS